MDNYFYFTFFSYNCLNRNEVGTNMLWSCVSSKSRTIKVLWCKRFELGSTFGFMKNVLTKYLIRIDICIVDKLHSLVILILFKCIRILHNIGTCFGCNWTCMSQGDSSLVIYQVYTIKPTMEHINMTARHSFHVVTDALWMILFLKMGYKIWHADQTRLYTNTITW